MLLFSNTTVFWVEALKEAINAVMGKRLAYYDMVIRNHAWKKGKIPNQLHAEFEDENFLDEEGLLPNDYESFLDCASRSFIVVIALADETVSFVKIS